MDDEPTEVATLRARLVQRDAQLRRAHEELAFAHETIRVLKRLIVRLIKDN